MVKLVEKDKVFDVIAGTADCILSLISLYRVYPSIATLNAAIQCGDYLLNQAQPMSAGVGWPYSKETGLAGFSHGVAGIAYSLLELSTLSQQKRFRGMALAGLEYERSLFSSEHHNWPELYEKDKPRYVATWCHGAAGVGLGRLAGLKHLDNTTVREEIKIALKTTIAEGFGKNHSLCHGDLGNLELLLVAGSELAEPDYMAQLNYITRKVLESIKSEGWLSGNPLAIEAPGLMTGLAGIGYGLLRVATPQIVPSVLLLAPAI